MNTEQLQAFIAVAEQGHLTAAAKRLGLSQPTLTRQLQALEREVGVRLLVRTPRGMVLSDAGTRFLTHAREALEALRAGTTELDELAHSPRGTVALGTMPTVGAHLLPPVLHAFIRRYPTVRIKLTEGLPDRLEQLVASGELDLAILNLPVRRQELVAQKLFQEDFVLVVPRGHRLAGPRRVALAQVVTEPFVVMPGTAGTLALQAACDAAGVEPQVVIEADSAESVRRMVERGNGVALLPALMARDRARVAIDVVEVANGPRRQVALVHRGERTLTAAARAMKRLISERLTDGG